MINYNIKFFGGLNTKYKTTLTNTLTEFDYMRNWISKNGKLYKRKGHALITVAATSNNNITALFRFENQSERKWFVGLYDKMYYSSKQVPEEFSSMTLGLSGLTANKLWRFQPYRDKVYAVNGYDEMIYWNGFTLKQVDPSETYKPPKCKYITSFYDYIFLAGDKDNPNIIYRSNQEFPMTFDPLSYINIDEDNNDYITGIFTFGRFMYVAKNNSIWICNYTENTTTPISVYPAFKNAGVLSPYSIVVFGDKVVFYGSLNGLKGIYLFDGNSFELLTDKIQDYIDTLSGAENFVATVSENVYKLFIHQKSNNDKQNTLGIQINVDLSSKNIYYYDNCYATSVYTDTDMQTIVGDKDGLLFWYDRKSADDKVGGTDAITSLAITKSNDFGTNNYKWIKEITPVIVGATDTGNITFRVYEHNNNTIETYSSKSLAPSMTLAAWLTAGGSTVWAFGAEETFKSVLLAINLSIAPRLGFYNADTAQTIIGALTAVVDTRGYTLRR